ncbi:MAG TPA: hypothetical protein VEK15_03550, partial [Vicinamibacteria bacterium]|nr:hypothetical protein [Vicinamibacteria bacterium]
IAAINIERSANERRQSGSVLFVDMDGVLDGRAKPAFLARKEVSPNAGARPEGLKKSNGGRFVWTANQRDGGSLSRFEIAETVAIP